MITTPLPGCHVRGPARQAVAPRQALSPAHVALAECWRALTKKVHDAWCLPELGGCEEELVDIRSQDDRGIVHR